MPGYGYTSKSLVALDGTSANSSVRTSNAFWVGDASAVAVSYVTATAVASVVSIDASLSDGMGTQAGFASGLTSAAAPNGDWLRFSSAGANAITTLSLQSLGAVRWVRFIRAAADSQASVVLATRT